MCARCGKKAHKRSSAKYRDDILLCNVCFPKHEEALKAQKFVTEDIPQ